MAAEESPTSSKFDRLFTKHVPHILEGIFFSLDYDSFMKCNYVSKAWKELYSSQRYQEKAEELLRRKRENEEKLIIYSKHGDHREVSNLLADGVNPNCEDAGHFKGNPLLYAAIRGHQAVVELLLNMGANPNVALDHSEDWEYWELGVGTYRFKTPLHFAAAHANNDMVRVLLNA